MAPSIVKLGAAAAAYAAVVQAANSSAYELVDEYTADNFFDKFDFYVSDFATGEYDPTHGFVNYRNQADAESLGMISSTDGSVHIGPNTAGTFSASGTGRDSVRIMSKNAYNQGLLIAKFSHLPVQACGAWPAFWSYGSPWLSTGEIDYYEGWNVIGNNVAALHTNETIAGECTLTTTGVSANVTTTDCNDEAYDPSINQYVGTGCGVSDASGIWGSTTGGTCKSSPLSAKPLLGLRVLTTTQSLWSGKIHTSRSGTGYQVPSRPTSQPVPPTQPRMRGGCHNCSSSRQTAISPRASPTSSLSLTSTSAVTLPETTSSGLRLVLPRLDTPPRSVDARLMLGLRVAHSAILTSRSRASLSTLSGVIRYAQSHSD